MMDPTSTIASVRIVDEFDLARAQEYALLATLLTRSPDAQLLRRISALHSDASAMGKAHMALADAARRTNEQAASSEFFALFAGLGKGALLPYASHYLSDTLYGRPLARLRETLEGLGLEAAKNLCHRSPRESSGCPEITSLWQGAIAENLSRYLGTDA